MRIEWNVQFARGLQTMKITCLSAKHNIGVSVLRQTRVCLEDVSFIWNGMLVIWLIWPKMNGMISWMWCSASRSPSGLHSTLQCSIGHVIWIMPIEKILQSRMFIGGPSQDMLRLYGLAREPSKTHILATHMITVVGSIYRNTWETKSQTRSGKPMFTMLQTNKHKPKAADDGR